MRVVMVVAEENLVVVVVGGVAPFARRDSCQVKG